MNHFLALNINIFLNSATNCCDGDVQVGRKTVPEVMADDWPVFRGDK